MSHQQLDRKTVFNLVYTQQATRMADAYDDLKAEVERLNLNAYKHLSMRIEIDKLNAQIKRLCNAGDAMALAIEGDYNYPLPCVQAWNAAKEGKPSV